MADPMFDNFARIIRGEASPATMRFWMGGNLHLDRISGWSSENLALAAWLAELRARMKENAPEPQLAEMRGLIRARFERERDGNYQGIEVYGRVYGLWNYVVRLALYRFCLRLGWAEEAALLRGWLRSHAAALVLAAGDGPGRQITDHQVAAGDADRGAAILGDGALLPWWDPFVAWSGDRGCQRTRDTAEWGRWQHLQESSLSAVVVSLLGLDNRTRQQTWMEWWEWVDALDEVTPKDGAPLGVTPAEVETLRAAWANDPAALREAASWLWRPPVPFRIVRTTEGVWTLSPVARGSSTAHLDACAWWRDGRTGYLCADPGWREPGGQGYVRPGTAWVKDGRAVAAREGRETVSMPLPGGTVLFDATIAPEGLQLTIPSAAGGESPPPPIAPPAPDSAPGRPGYRSSDRRRNVALGAWVAAVLGSLLGRWLGRKKEETK
ncbi:MAG TPA: hypothetical protein PK570_00895 [Thermoanaerobaculia bacterium]|jgi:hypothetical protein|nr:MAG: hypothetical protein BWX64_02082 [Acidobacteria bacterium ADurb.Bin051]HPA96841.1 hypothetical protein [Thermoanaerobaculia bacterium]HQP92497.1 hypothetical protein [Thermoanaerobaculia bacterium]HRS37481.1 hypothetical protein [Thermoanaerobaculia bacterium]